MALQSESRQPGQGSADVLSVAQRPPPRRRNVLRRILLAAGPVIVAAGALTSYLLGGRYVSEENSYVGAETVAIATQVSGQVAQLGVAQNQKIAAQSVLFVIDPEPYRLAADGARAQLGMVHDQIAAQIETYKARTQQAEQAKANLTYAEQQLQRAQQLFNSGSGTQLQLDTARKDQQSSAAAVASAEADARAALAQIGGDGDLPIEQRPQYLSAKATLETAERNLRLTEVRAPWNGTAT